MTMIKDRIEKDDRQRTATARTDRWWKHTDWCRDKTE